MINPLREFRRKQGMTRQDLAFASGLNEYDIIQIESGKSGLPGELQIYLADKGINVSEIASEQSAFIAGLKSKKSA